MATVVISVRAPIWIKEYVEKYGINVRDVVKKALIDEIKRRRKRRLDELVDKVLASSSIGVDEWVESIREDREGR